MTDPLAASPTEASSVRKGRRQLARTLLNEHADSLDNRSHRAAEMIRAGRGSEAVPLLRAVAEDRPDDPGAWLHLYALVTSLSDLQGSIEALRRQVELGSEDPAVLARLSNLIRQADRRSGVKIFRAQFREDEIEGGLDIVREGLSGADSADICQKAVRWFVNSEVSARVRDRLFETVAAKPADDASWDPIRRVTAVIKVVAPDFADLRREMEVGRDPAKREAILQALLGGLVLLEASTPDEPSKPEQALVKAALWTELLDLVQSDLDVQLTVLSRHLTVDPGNPRTVHLKARVLLLLGRRAEAHELLREAMSAFPTAEGMAGPAIRLLADAGDPDARKASGRHRPTSSPAGVPDSQTRGRLPASTLIFPHAHKTGGTSLHRGLGALFGLGYMRQGNLRSMGKVLRNLTVEAKQRLDLIAGHFPYDTAEDELAGLLPKRPLYVGVVRDPISRARSVYSFFGERYDTAEERDSQLRVPYDADINVVVERWMDAPDRWSSWRSDQCLCVGGQPAAADVIPVVEHRYLALVTPSGINQLIAAVARAMGVEPGIAEHIKRSNSERFVIRPDLEERLGDFYAEDQQLHDWAKANEDRFIARAETWMAEEVAAAG